MMDVLKVKLEQHFEKQLLICEYKMGELKLYIPVEKILKVCVQLRDLFYFEQLIDIRGVDYEFEWDDFDALLIVTLQSPGSNTIIEYFSQEQRIEIEQSPFGLLDTLNNIHRAKHTTTLWRYTSDFSAIVMIIFCLSGLWLALINKNTRRASSQWFVTGSSLFLLVLYLMH